MTEKVMSINAVPSFLTTTLRTGKVKVREMDGEVWILPVPESPAVKDKMSRLYELCGSGADLNMTVDSFLDMTHSEREVHPLL